MAAAEALSRVPDVDIDGDGVFKYVLLRVRAAGGPEKDVVRGHGWAEYHADIYEQTAQELAQQGLGCECLGGGRLSHRPQERKIHVYGYSVRDWCRSVFHRHELSNIYRKLLPELLVAGFGRADHSVTTEKLRAEYPDYEVTWADEGY